MARAVHAVAGLGAGLAQLGAGGGVPSVTQRVQCFELKLRTGMATNPDPTQLSVLTDKWSWDSIGLRSLPHLQIRRKTACQKP